MVLQAEITEAIPVYTKMVIMFILRKFLAWKQLSRKKKCPPDSLSWLLSGFHALGPC